MAADGAYYPYVKDLNNRWHKRPIDDGWIREGDVQAHTMCGLAVGSVSVSYYDPRLNSYYRDRYCKCLGKIEKEQ